MTTTASAQDNAPKVLISENGRKGDPGTNGTDGSGFNQVRKSKLDNPLCHLFKTNKLVEASAPTGTDSDVTWTRSTTGTYIDRYGVVQTAAIDTPREEKEGFLIEGASTNLALYSEELDNAAYGKTGASISINAVNAPDGTLTMDKIVEDTSTGAHFAQQTITTTISNVYSISFFVKAAERDIVFLGVSGLGTVSLYYDITNKVFASVGVGVISTKQEQLLDATRITLTFQAAAASSTPQIALSDSIGSTSYTGDGASGAYVWGFQFEELNFSTSYIKTAASSSTRTLDVVNVPYTNNHPSVMTSGDFSYSVTCSLLGVDAATFPVLTSINNYQYSMIRIDNSSDLAYYRSNTPVTAAVPDVANNFNIAVSVSINTTTLFLDGSQVATASQVPALEVEPTTINFGTGTGNQLYGHIKDFRAYDFALNADEVEYLS